MLGTILGALPLAQTSAPMAPVVVLVLCVIAGVGTVLLLPSKQEASIRAIGAAVLIAIGLIFAAILIRWTAGSAAGIGIYFWIFSAIALVGAVRVITHPKPVYSALYFVMTVFASAGLFLLLWAEFMAVALVLIYAGAILVTYVFVIMLAAEATNQESGVHKLAEHDALSREPIVAAAVGFALMGVLLFVIFDKAAVVTKTPVADSPIVTGSTQQLGSYLFQNHVINLELAGLILTIAMVGAIMIAKRRVIGGEKTEPGIVIGPATPVDDNPHSIPVFGTTNPRQKAFPET
jgi:NADH-quinone oxidoreductase subunit J